MNDPTRIINWVGLSQKLAKNQTSVSKNRCPKKYKPRVNSLIKHIEEWSIEPKPITEKELFRIGFRRYGDEEKDPYYKLVLNSKVLGVDALSGNFIEKGVFEIYSMRKFNDISEIEKIIKINGFEVDWNIANRYGVGENN